MTQKIPDNMGTLLIRADAGSSIGIGHLMRCIALGQAWLEKGGEVIFLSCIESDALRKRVTSEGFKLMPIAAAHPALHDIEQLLAVTATVRSKLWIVLDGYHFDPEYQKKIKENGFHLLVIDDMGHLAQYHADILLNQNIYAPAIEYSCDSGTARLMGCEYALTRREFRERKAANREIPSKIRNLLVTMGGSDPTNITVKIIEAITLLDDPSLHAKIIIGPNNHHIESLKEAVKKSPMGFELLANVTQMPLLMEWADVAITAAGTTCMELMMMGLPFGTLVLADNQERVAEGLAERYQIPNFGWAINIPAARLSKEIQKFIDDNKLLRSLSAKGQQIVTGNGTQKVIGKMLKKA